LQQATVLQQVGYSQTPLLQRGLPPMTQQLASAPEQLVPSGWLVTVQPPEPLQTELASHEARVHE
jgi:hypothetical protein